VNTSIDGPTHDVPFTWVSVLGEKYSDDKPVARTGCKRSVLEMICAQNAGGDVLKCVGCCVVVTIQPESLRALEPSYCSTTYSLTHFSWTFIAS
jgi:hypothetical protein